MEGYQFENFQNPVLKVKVTKTTVTITILFSLISTTPTTTPKILGHVQQSITQTVQTEDRRTNKNTDRLSLPIFHQLRTTNISEKW